MANRLKVSVGQYSDKGRKEINQDFHGMLVPNEPHLSSKGIAVALADGISSSNVSQVASQAAVTSFLDDYYCTSEAWSVRTSAERVLAATNSWLYSQTQQSQGRYDKDKGYVCTLSAVVIKAATAHLFHVGDSRIYRLRKGDLEQKTSDHRMWLSTDQSYLSRALGITPQLDIDHTTLPVEKGDVFVLVTDGVYGHVAPGWLIDAINKCQDDLDSAARIIAEEAYRQGSTDNLTIQLVRVEEISGQPVNEIHRQLSELPFPPMLEARTVFDGYKIIRSMHDSSRSHIHLATDCETGEMVVIKTPSIDLRGDPVYMERFLMEEWVARRIDSPHVLKPCRQTRKRHFLYVVTEFIEGQTLAQWMIDHPKPDLETARGIVEQIAKGLLAFHRMEMLHQDLRPENIMIDRSGTVKIIDFGSTRVAGIAEAATTVAGDDILGTAQYTAPEYFLGEGGSPRSDLFSLAVITYQMLSGRLPYGAQVAKSRTRSAQMKLVYDPVLDDNREIPAWIDGVLRKAVHPNPALRYEELSEFVFDLRHPNRAFLDKARPPLIERNPAGFWKSVSLVLAVIVVVLLHALQQR
jgi:serine/threonine protein phosphatase PrpC